MKKSIILSLFVILVISFFFSCDNNDNSATERYWEFYNSKLASFKQENFEYQNQSVDVVFLGDSLTEG